MTGPLELFRRLSVGRSLFGASVLALGLAAAQLAANPAEPVGADAEWQMTLKARNTLWDDPVFEKLNLGVTVQQGVATLNGAVPSTAVAEQAVTLLKGVPGVRGVVNETYVPPVDDPRTKAMPHPITTQRPTESAAQPPAPATATVGPVPASPKEMTGTATGKAVPPVAAPSGPQTIGEQIDQLRQRDRRFVNVRAEVRNGRVTLRGTVARSQDAWEFAAAVRRLPGVVGVVQGITTDR
jgi:osmotically-inducible protein OsmY